jgi:hypothetical protein
MNKRYHLNSRGDLDELVVRLKGLGNEIGASVELGGESPTLCVANATDETMALVNAELAATGFKILAEVVPDYFAARGLDNTRGRTNDRAAKGPTIH